MPHHTDSLFTDHAVPKSQFSGNSIGTFTEVPYNDISFFHKYEVHDWTDFENEAAKVLASNDKKTITVSERNAILYNWSSAFLFVIFYKT